MQQLLRGWARLEAPRGLRPHRLQPGQTWSHPAFWLFTNVTANQVPRPLGSETELSPGGDRRSYAPFPQDTVASTHHPVAGRGQPQRRGAASAGLRGQAGEDTRQDKGAGPRARPPRATSQRLLPPDRGHREFLWLRTRRGGRECSRSLHKPVLGARPQLTPAGLGAAGGHTGLRVKGRGQPGREGRVRPWLQRSSHKEAICPREGTVLAEELGDTAVTTVSNCQRAIGHSLLHGVAEGPCCSCSPPASTWCPPGTPGGGCIPCQASH